MEFQRIGASQQRYARHLTLAGFGAEGQRRLSAAHVVVIGAGGLGVPVGQYLVAAGIGRLTVVDDDVVDLSNLQRQVVHRTADVGAAKIDSFVRLGAELNPDVEVVGIRERVVADNVLRLLEDADVVVDATDNFATRFLLNDACVLLGLPLVWAAVQRFDAQLTVWSPGAGPCLRCLFPAAPDPASVPSCAEAGVLGVLPGLVGTAQALEAIKLLTGIGEPLIGRLAVFDALGFGWSEVPVRRDPQCPTCAEGAAPLLEDAPAACAVSEASPAEVASALREGSILLIDVRTQQEREIARIEGAEWVPLDDLRAGATVATDRPVVVMCRSGMRSAAAVNLLAERGIAARSMRGGILAWAAEIDPALPLA
ncbi:molybdopterin-synthase adenylyltransferase MoeB [Calidifontibacter terrae]